MKNEQIVLDRVLAHLKAQGWERSFEDGVCRNRDNRGRKCAVACLLDDQALDACNETLCATIAKAARKFKVSKTFITYIQRCHDTGATPESMKLNFVGLAACHELDAGGVQ